MSLAVMRLEEVKASEIILVWPDREITGRNAEVFLNWITNEIRRSGANLTVDLGGVDYINAAGLAAMVRAAKMAPSKGASILWKNLGYNVRIIIEITGLAKILNIRK